MSKQHEQGLAEVLGVTELTERQRLAVRQAEKVYSKSPVVATAVCILGLTNIPVDDDEPEDEDDPDDEDAREPETDNVSEPDETPAETLESLGVPYSDKLRRGKLNGGGQYPVTDLPSYYAFMEKHGDLSKVSGIGEVSAAEIVEYISKL